MKSTTANFTVDSNILIYAFGSQNEEKNQIIEDKPTVVNPFLKLH